MNEPDEASRAYRTVARAIELIRARADRQPELAEIAQAVGLSESHLQRVFASWVGISPKRFLQYVTKEHAKRALAGADVLNAAAACGLSGPGRLHDLLVVAEAVSPGEYRSGGAGLDIVWGVHASPFGPAFVAATPRGICRLAFVEPAEAAAECARLQAEWPHATLRHAPAEAAALLARIFDPPPEPKPLHLWIRGSNFQLQVWQALLRIPPGRLVSYGELAAYLQVPHAARAVGNAVGANPVAYLIPCHRVIRAGGEPGGYRWGLPRKHALIGWEAARAAHPA